MKFEEPSLDNLIHQDLPLDELRHRLVQGITDYEGSFRRNYPVVWFIGVAGPFIITISALLTIGFLFSWLLAGKFIVNSVAAFFFFGRFAILGGGVLDGTGWEKYVLSTSQLFGMITFNDLMVALFVTFNMGILFKIPYVGPKIAGLTCDGKFIMEQQPWIRKVAWLSTVALVIFPAASTGSVGGSIFGRLLGLDRVRTISAVAIGSIAGNSIMLYFGKLIEDLTHGPMKYVITISGIAFVVLAIYGIEWQYRKAKDRYIAAYEQRHKGETKSGTPASNE
jgi:bacteriorhodopsin